MLHHGRGDISIKIKKNICIYLKVKDRGKRLSCGISGVQNFRSLFYTFRRYKNIKHPQAIKLKSTKYSKVNMSVFVLLIFFFPKLNK